MRILPPDGFGEDYERLRTYFDWTRATDAGAKRNIPQMKLVVEEWREVLAKRQSPIKDPEIARGLTGVAAWLEQANKVLEIDHLEQLQAVLRARRDWLAAEGVFK